MDPLGWIVIYLIGFTLVQLLLFRYFSDEGSLGAASLGSREASAPGSVEADVRDAGRATGSDGEDVEGVRCRECGAINADEPTISYCRECLAQLH